MSEYNDAMAHAIQHSLTEQVVISDEPSTPMMLLSNSIDDDSVEIFVIEDEIDNVGMNQDLALAPETVFDAMEEQIIDTETELFMVDDDADPFNSINTELSKLTTNINMNLINFESDSAVVDAEGEASIIGYIDPSLDPEMIAQEAEALMNAEGLELMDVLADDELVELDISLDEVLSAVAEEEDQTISLDGTHEGIVIFDSADWVAPDQEEEIVQNDHRIDEYSTLFFDQDLGNNS